MQKTSAVPSLLLSTICALGLMTCVVDAQIPDSLTNGLVSYYPFNGDANDAVGPNNATVVGATLTAGVTGTPNTAYSFSGGSTYLTAAYTPATNNAFTWSLWIKASAISIADSYPLSASIAGESGISPNYIVRPTGNIGFSSYDDALSGEENEFINVLDSSATLATNVWTMLTITSDTNNLRSIYINGIFNTNKVSSGYGSASRTNLMFGADMFLRDDNSLFGSLDDVAIYDRPLSATEVTDLYNAQSVPEPSTYALLLISAAASIFAFKRRKR